MSNEIIENISIAEDKLSVASRTAADIKLVPLNKSMENKSQESTQMSELSFASEKLKALFNIRCSEDKAFVLSNNKRLHSIKDLLGYLPDMPEDVFNHHVRFGRNDFANWINGVFEEKELAKLVENSNTIGYLIITLKEYFKV